MTPKDILYGIIITCFLKFYSATYQIYSATIRIYSVTPHIYSATNLARSDYENSIMISIMKFTYSDICKVRVALVRHEMLTWSGAPDFICFPFG